MLNSLTNPFELIERGGRSIAAGILLLTFYLFVFFVLFLIARRIVSFGGAKKSKVSGRVVNKYVIREHREWQGKALVTVPDQMTLDVDVDGYRLTFAPALWKYDRVNEGDEIVVLVQRGRLKNDMRVVDIGPF